MATAAAAAATITGSVVTSTVDESTSSLTSVLQSQSQQQQQQQIKYSTSTSSSSTTPTSKMVTVSGNTNTESFNTKKSPVKKLHQDVISLGSTVAKVTGIKIDELITSSSDQDNDNKSTNNTVPIYGVKVDNENELSEIMKDIDYWGMNIFQVRQCTSGYPLTAVFYTILRVSK